MARSLFNAAAGHAASDKKIEEASNQIAADIDNLLDDPTVGRQVKENLLARIAELVANPESVTAFAAGTYAQATASDGSPARALGSGTGSATSIPAPDAYKALLAAPETDVSTGVKHLLVRIFDPRATDPITVDNNGTPTDVNLLQQQVTALTKQLDNQKDESFAGSLAAQLKKANDDLRAVPTNVVDKAKVRTIATKLAKLAGARASRTNDRNTTVPDIKVDAVLAAYDELRQLGS